MKRSSDDGADAEWPGLDIAMAVSKQESAGPAAGTTRASGLPHGIQDTGFLHQEELLVHNM